MVHAAVLNMAFRTPAGCTLCKIFSGFCLERNRMIVPAFDHDTADDAGYGAGFLFTAEFANVHRRFLVCGIVNKKGGFKRPPFIQEQ